MAASSNHNAHTQSRVKDNKFAFEEVLRSLATTLKSINLTKWNGEETRKAKILIKSYANFLTPAKWTSVLFRSI